MEDCGYLGREPAEGYRHHAGYGSSPPQLELPAGLGPQAELSLAAKERYRFHSPSLDSPSTHTRLDPQRGYLESTPGRPREHSPPQTTTPTSALHKGRPEPSAVAHVIRLNAHAGIRPPQGLLATRGSGIPPSEAEEGDEFEEAVPGAALGPAPPRRCTRRMRSGMPRSPEPQASLTRAQVEALSSHGASLGHEGDRDSYGFEAGREHGPSDYEDSEELGDLDDRQPAKRVRRRVEVETKDANGKPYTAQEIRRMKRRITNRESARRMRLKRQEEWGDIKQLTRQLREINRQQANRIAHLERQNQRLQTELAVCRDKYEQLGGRGLLSGRAPPSLFTAPNVPAAEGYPVELGSNVPQLRARATAVEHAPIHRSSSVAVRGPYGAGSGPLGAGAHFPAAPSHPLISAATLPAALPQLPSYLGPYGRALERGPSGVPSGASSQQAIKREESVAAALLEVSSGQGLLDPPGGAEQPHIEEQHEPLASIKSMDVALGLDQDADEAFARSLTGELGMQEGTSYDDQML